MSKSKKEKTPDSIPQENYFFCRDGRIFKNLRELAVALKDMSEETFKHHVNEGKNDFANWIKDIIKDIRLADKISGLKAKELIRRTIEDNINRL